MDEATFALIDDGMPRLTTARDGVAEARKVEAEGRPVALDEAEGAAYLGVSAAARGRQLASLEAPDFSLPDLDGRRHSLSDHRGKKVFLVAYGSW